jgi:DNA-binding CsgD family transcriptional regulator/tetratricopeptide (TPR) repeat protein
VSSVTVQRTAGSQSVSVAGQGLVGRHHELDWLSRWVAELSSGRGGAALVEGEPGIGKSALLRAVWEHSIDAGWAAFWGAGEELGQPFPLLPLLDAFAVRETSADPVRVDVLRLLHGQPGQGGSVAGAAERLVELIDDACADTPAVLVVDDLHWADADTVALWHRLARTAQQRPLLLLGATRPLPHRPDLQALRRSLEADRQLQLEPLPAAAVADLVADLAGATPGPSLTQLADGAAGNPLYLTELVDALDRGHRLTVDGGVAEATAGPTPGTLTDAIIDRLDFLPAPARQTLQAAALLGGDFTVDELSLALARNPADLAADLAEARTAGVLTDAGGRLAFRHPLIRSALYDSMPAAVRAPWHRETAKTLHQAGAPVERVARQLLPTIDEERPDLADDWVVDWLVEAAPLLVGEAARAMMPLLRLAVRQLSSADPRQHRLASHLARAQGYQADFDTAEKLIGQTLPHVRDDDVLVDLCDTLARIRMAPRSRLGETVADIEQALAIHPALTAQARGRLELIIARLHNARGDSYQAEQIARRALAKAAETGDRWAVSQAANLLGVILGLRGDARASLEVLDQGLAATEDQADLTLFRLRIQVHRAEAYKHLDRLDDARGAVADAGRLGNRSGNRLQLTATQALLCELLFLAGQWDDALTESVLPDEVDAPIDQCLTHGVATVVSCHRGDLQTARRRLAAGQALVERIPHELPAPWPLADALLQEAANDPAAALCSLRDRLPIPDADAETELWLADTVRLAVHAGDQETALKVTAWAEALAADCDVPHRTAGALHCRGLVAEDPHLLLAAAKSYRRAPRPLAQAQALEAAAGLLAEHGDSTAARAPFTDAFDIYTTLGAEWDITRMRSRFRRHGLQGRRPRRQASTGWAALTATETKVASLVAEGRTNREIADALSMSRYTVDTHVARILAKLQLRSRFEIVRAAARRGAKS